MAPRSSGGPPRRQKWCSAARGTADERACRARLLCSCRRSCQVLVVNAKQCIGGLIPIQARKLLVRILMQGVAQRIVLDYGGNFFCPFIYIPEIGLSSVMHELCHSRLL